MKIAAVIVTYNRRDKLERCLRAVLSQDCDNEPDIFVVDNGSSDGTDDLVQDMIQSTTSTDTDGHIIYDNLRHNSGGAGGFCHGIRKTTESGYDLIWLMDDDCVPAPDALRELLAFDRDHHGEYGFLSGRIVWRDGSLHHMNIQRETVIRNVCRDNDEPVRVEMASFCSLLLPTEIVRRYGLPYREFFIWTDDWEYTRRISRELQCWLVPSSVMMHDTLRNEAADISIADPDIIDRFRYLYRNDVFLYRREGIKGFCYEAARLVWHVIKVAKSINAAAEKRRRIGIIIRGTVEGLRFYPVPERVRLR